MNGNYIYLDIYHFCCQYCRLLLGIIYPLSEKVLSIILWEQIYWQKILFVYLPSSENIYILISKRYFLWIWNSGLIIIFFQHFINVPFCSGLQETNVVIIINVSLQVMHHYQLLTTLCVYILINQVYYNDS